MYYDCPRGHDLNVVRDQLSGGEPPVYHVEWANGSSYLFDPATSTCRQTGSPPPSTSADGFDCHMWSNFIFSRYYADVATGRLVRWIFNCSTRHADLVEFRKKSLRAQRI
ncbi:hypothetical protein E2562_020767 [Oryza meyeriana var. granulata]|uniref:Uncharacterized protein n=1 Tax=Oryza meyeriana var. granulata TaxID=110450 RepID=A0A6G1CHM9_9ORYZ|nr:hypothetical protein E2562_020767 [Oryza meyeriana var. granulata]